MAQRIPLDHLTSNQYDALCDELDMLRRQLAFSERIRANADFHLGREMARRQQAETRDRELRARLADAEQGITAAIRQRKTAEDRALRAETERDQHAAALTTVQSIVAAWYASSEGRDVLIEDLAAAGHPLPAAEPDQPAAKPTRGTPMTFEYTDPDGYRLEVRRHARADGTPITELTIVSVNRRELAVHIPLDRVEELVAGIRDTARQAAVARLGADAVLAASDQELEQLREHADRYRVAWRSARRRARVLSDELTRRAPLTGQYAAALARVRALHYEVDGSPHANGSCITCGDDYPCPTYRTTLDGPTAA